MTHPQRAQTDRRFDHFAKFKFRVGYSLSPILSFSLIASYRIWGFANLASSHFAPSHMHRRTANSSARPRPFITLDKHRFAPILLFFGEFGMSAASVHGDARAPAAEANRSHEFYLLSINTKHVASSLAVKAQLYDPNTHTLA